LLGEFAFCPAHLLPGRPGPGALALQRRGAGADLDQAQLLGGQRGLLVGLVLAVREQAPEQDRELARDGDDRDPVAAAGADPLIQGVQRAGLVDDRPGRLDERPARRGRTLLWRSGHRAPARCRTGARAVKAEVADQRSRCAEATARRPTRPVETEVPGCMEGSDEGLVATFHDTSSGGGDCRCSLAAWQI
jgi:hypothetical protein